MKRIFILSFVLLLIASKSFSDNHIKIESPIPAQDSIVGYFQLERLNTPPFSFWFEPEHEAYITNNETLMLIDKDQFSNLTITIVIGTWCHDSQRETPRFVKILSEIDFDFEKITAIGVNKEKKAVGTSVDELKIDFVPTIIFYMNGKEIGRIIETPEESLEKDMLRILSSE